MFYSYILLIKLSSEGDIEWVKSYGGTSRDDIISVSEKLIELPCGLLLYLIVKLLKLIKLLFCKISLEFSPLIIVCCLIISFIFVT